MRLVFDNIQRVDNCFLLGYIPSMPLSNIEKAKLKPLKNIYFWADVGELRPEVKDAIIEYISQEFKITGTKDDFSKIKQGVITIYAYHPGIPEWMMSEIRFI